MRVKTDKIVLESLVKKKCRCSFNCIIDYYMILYMSKKQPRVKLITDC